MNYITVRAKSQEEFLEILSSKMTSREKDLDDGRLIGEQKKVTLYASPNRMKKIKNFCRVIRDHSRACPFFPIWLFIIKEKPAT